MRVASDLRKLEAREVDEYTVNAGACSVALGKDVARDGRALPGADNRRYDARTSEAVLSDALVALEVESDGSCWHRPALQRDARDSDTCVRGRRPYDCRASSAYDVGTGLRIVSFSEIEVCGGHGSD